MSGRRREVGRRVVDTDNTPHGGCETDGGNRRLSRRVVSQEVKTGHHNRSKTVFQTQSPTTIASAGTVNKFVGTSTAHGVHLFGWGGSRAFCG